MSSFPTDYLEELGRIIVDFARLEVNLRYVYSAMGSTESIQWDNIDDELGTTFVGTLKSDLVKRFKHWSAGITPIGDQDLAGLLRDPPTIPDDKPKGFAETMQLVQLALDSRNKIIHSVWMWAFNDVPENFDPSKLVLIRQRIAKVEDHDTQLTDIDELRAVVKKIKEADDAVRHLQAWIMGFASNQRRCDVILSEIKEEMVRIFSQQLRKMLTFQRFFKQLAQAMLLADYESGMGDEYDDQADELKWFLYDGYIVHNCVAIRKILDEDKGSVSFVNLLKKLEPILPKLTRATYCQACLDATDDPASMPKWANDHFLSQTNLEFDKVTNGQPELTAGQIAEDIKALKEACRPVRKLVNKVIAHTDRNFSGGMTHGELDNAIDVIKNIYDRYAILLGGPHVSEADDEQLFNISLPLARAFPKMKKAASSSS